MYSFIGERRQPEGWLGFEQAREQIYGRWLIRLPDVLIVHLLPSAVNFLSCRVQRLLSPLHGYFKGSAIEYENEHHNSRGNLQVRPMPSASTPMLGLCGQTHSKIRLLHDEILVLTTSHADLPSTFAIGVSLCPILEHPRPSRPIEYLLAPRSMGPPMSSNAKTIMLLNSVESRGRA